LTYWATLWYAGAVVIQIGYEGQTQYECEVLAESMRVDIEASYADPSKIDDLALSLFPTNEFSVTCEAKRLVTDERYVE
jgi:hypothetical protein